jgi:hypothetical protein
MRREPGSEVFAFDCGDYMLTEDRTGVWLRTPTGALIRVPVREGEQDTRPIGEGGCWGFEEHEDGSLSLTPSLDVHGPDPWHGHLTRGQMI